MASRHSIRVAVTRPTEDDAIQPAFDKTCDRLVCPKIPDLLPMWNAHAGWNRCERRGPASGNAATATLCRLRKPLNLHRLRRSVAPGSLHFSQPPNRDMVPSLSPQAGIALQPVTISQPETNRSALCPRSRKRADLVGCWSKWPTLGPVTDVSCCLSSFDY